MSQTWTQIRCVSSLCGWTRLPAAGLVVLRGLWRGLVFFTDYKSDKGAELAANLRGAVLHWLVPAHRQVCVRGRLSG